MTLTAITNRLIRDLDKLTFAEPVSHVYNPLRYARQPYDRYLKTYAGSAFEVVLVGMNPGPWGMAQTGVPFGDVAAVRDWLGIRAPVAKPAREHPKRPVEGFDCPRNEVSGQRLWGWARERFGTPEAFFARFFVANYCPLMFLEKSGRNRTPDKLPVAERKPLLEVCDRALGDTLALLTPRFAVGIGRFAAQRVETASAGRGFATGRITHPSPANPKANRGWSALVDKELRALGIGL